MKNINGKKVNITSAGYIYIDGVKASKHPVTPLTLHLIYPDIDDHDIIDYVKKWSDNHYVMC